MATVVLNRVSKIFPNGFKAVSDISFTVEEKEIAVVVGPSGCGKTTTLRLIAGLEDCSEGQVLIDGKEMSGVPPRDRDVALVFQNDALYPHMTVFENMALGLRLRRYSKQEIRNRVNRAAVMLRISDVLDRKPKQLSGGQRQRVAVGRAIVRKPRVFLFDEPLSNLDAQLRMVMRIEIANLHRELGATMVYVTHDQIEAMTLGQRIIVVNDGTIQQIASPRELYRRPVNLFVATFIGSPTMNLFTGTIDYDSGAPVFSSSSSDIVLPLDIDGRMHEIRSLSLTAGVRAEDICLVPENVNGNDAELLMQEHSGADSLLYLRRGDDKIVARSSSEPVDGEIRFAVDPQRIHLFDSQTGRALL